MYRNYFCPPKANSKIFFLKKFYFHHSPIQKKGEGYLQPIKRSNTKYEANAYEDPLGTHIFSGKRCYIGVFFCNLLKYSTMRHEKNAFFLFFSSFFDACNLVECHSEKHYLCSVFQERRAEIIDIVEASCGGDPDRVLVCVMHTRLTHTRSASAHVCDVVRSRSERRQPHKISLKGVRMSPQGGRGGKPPHRQNATIFAKEQKWGANAINARISERDGGRA